MFFGFWHSNLFRKGGESCEQKKQVVFVRRDTGEKSFIAVSDAPKIAKKILNEIQTFLQKRADKLLKDSMSSPKDYDDLVKIQNSKRGFSRINWCGDRACADKIKDDTSADIRGTREDIVEKPEGNCIVCGKKAKEVVYVASAY